MSLFPVPSVGWVWLSRMDLGSVSLHCLPQNRDARRLSQIWNNLAFTVFNSGCVFTVTGNKAHSISNLQRSTQKMHFNKVYYLFINILFTIFFFLTKIARSFFSVWGPLPAILYGMYADNTFLISFQSLNALVNLLFLKNIFSGYSILHW